MYTPSVINIASICVSVLSSVERTTAMGIENVSTAHGRAGYFSSTIDRCKLLSIEACGSYPSVKLRRSNHVFALGFVGGCLKANSRSKLSSGNDAIIKARANIARKTFIRETQRQSLEPRIKPPTVGPKLPPAHIQNLTVNPEEMSYS